MISLCKKMLTMVRDNSDSLHITADGGVDFGSDELNGQYNVLVDEFEAAGQRQTEAQLEQIAKEKMPDLNTRDLDAAKRMIAGTARSMGIQVK